MTILGYPGIPPQEASALNLLNQTVVTCPPFTSTVTLFGVTSDNPGTVDVEPAVNQRTVAANGTWIVDGINVSALADGLITYTATLTDSDGNTFNDSLIAWGLAAPSGGSGL